MQPSEQQQLKNPDLASRQRDMEPTSSVEISVSSTTTPRSVQKRSHNPYSSSEGSGEDDEEDDGADAEEADNSKTITRASASSAYRGKCLYQSRKCENERALKRNGKAHNLCEEHRSKQNQHQRKFDAKKFTRKRRKGAANQSDEVDENDHHYRAEVVYYDHDRQPYTYQRRSSASAIPGLYEVRNMAGLGSAMLHGAPATSSDTSWPVKPEPTRRHSYMNPSTCRAYLEPRQAPDLGPDFLRLQHRPSFGYHQPPQSSGPLLRSSTHQDQALFPIRKSDPNEAANLGYPVTTEVASRYAPLGHLVRSSSDYTASSRVLPSYSQSDLHVASSLVPQRQYSPEGSSHVHLHSSSHAAMQDDPQQMLRAIHHNRRPLDIRVSRQSPVATSHGHDLSFSPLGGRKLPSLHVTTGPPTSVYAPPLAASSPIVAITMRPTVSRSTSPPVRLSGGPILPSLAPIHPRPTSS